MKRLFALTALLLCSAPTLATGDQVLFNPPIEFSDMKLTLKETKGLHFYVKSMKWGKTVVGRHLFVQNTTLEPLCVKISYPKAENVLSQLFEMPAPIHLEVGGDEFLGAYWSKEVTAKSHLQIKAEVLDKEACL